MSLLEDDVTIVSDNLTLTGSLLRPSTSETHPAILIVSGSGPTDRDGNQPNLKNDSLKLLAQGLAAQGFASLRYDKRGIRKSAAPLREEDLRFSDFVADARAWLAFLGQHEKLGPIFLAGHSEGALIATLAAQNAAIAGLILLAGAGYPAGQIIRRQLVASGLPPATIAAADEILQTLERGQTADHVPDELSALFRTSVQPYLISWLKYDPAQEIEHVLPPTLIVQGMHDLQLLVEDAKRLAAHNPRASLELLDGVNHILKIAPEDRAANFRTYADATAPVSRAVILAIAHFVKTIH